MSKETKAISVIAVNNGRDMYYQVMVCFSNNLPNTYSNVHWEEVSNIVYNYGFRNKCLEINQDGVEINIFSEQKD